MDKSNNVHEVSIEKGEPFNGLIQVFDYIRMVNLNSNLN